MIRRGLLIIKYHVHSVLQKHLKLLLVYLATGQMKLDLNVWYMDDGTIGGEVNNLPHDLMLKTKESRQLCLCVNVHKCELITSDTEVVRRFQVLTPKSPMSHLLPQCCSELQLVVVNFQHPVSRIKSL